VWDLADRMRKALRTSNIAAGEMATYLDVDRSSVSNWLSGRIKPSRQTLRLWALRTGVSYEWLSEGKEPPASPHPDGGVSAGQPRGKIFTYRHRALAFGCAA
jgi:transcriptional regulator with XRE-family HTH domain